MVLCKPRRVSSEGVRGRRVSVWLFRGLGRESRWVVWVKEDCIVAVLKNALAVTRRQRFRKDFMLISI